MTAAAAALAAALAATLRAFFAYSDFSAVAAGAQQVKLTGQQRPSRNLIKGEGR